MGFLQYFYQNNNAYNVIVTVRQIDFVSTLLYLSPLGDNKITKKVKNEAKEVQAKLN